MVNMKATGKIAIGVGIASGALLAAWLLTGTRKEKTKKFISRSAASLRKNLKPTRRVFDDSEAHYV